MARKHDGPGEADTDEWGNDDTLEVVVNGL